MINRIHDVYTSDAKGHGISSFRFSTTFIYLWCVCACVSHIGQTAARWNLISSSTSVLMDWSSSGHQPWLQIGFIHWVTSLAPRWPFFSTVCWMEWELGCLLFIGLTYWSHKLGHCLAYGASFNEYLLTGSSKSMNGYLSHMT